MIREWIKTGAAGALSRTGMDGLLGSLRGSGSVPVVVGYHQVVEDFAMSARSSIPSMLVSRKMLERHLDWMGHRFRFVTLDEVGARLDGSDGTRDPIAAVTFDDGYRDFMDHAFPLLRQKGVPAAVFVVTDLVGSQRTQIHDQLYLLLSRILGGGRRAAELSALLRRYGIALPGVDASTPFEATRTLLESLPQESIQRVIAALESDAAISEDTNKPFYSLTWDMLEGLQRAGITIGSHTRSHVLLPNEKGERVNEELTSSRAAIEQRLGTKVRHFAYPSGEFNSDSVDAVANAGYGFAYTTCGHRDAEHPNLTVPRILLWENSCRDFRGEFSGDILSCQIHRVFDVVSGCRQKHRVTRGSKNARV